MLFVTFLAAAASQPQVLGVGTNSCGTYLETKNQPMARGVFMQWLQGLFTQYNITNRDGIGDITAHTDFNGMAAWLDSYCAAQPLVPFGTASEALLSDLKQLERRASATKP